MAHLNLVMIHPFRDGNGRIARALQTMVLHAQRMRRRFDEAETQWRQIDDLLGEHKLNERVGTALFDALLGLRVTRPSCMKLTELDERTATRDLVKAAELGLLEPRGERRGRHYVAGTPLRAIQEQLRGDRTPLEDPHPPSSARSDAPFPSEGLRLDNPRSSPTMRIAC